MKLLKSLYRISSPSGMEDEMIRFIARRLESLGVDYSVDRVGNIYATKGYADTYPCLVAHTDEIHHLRSGRFEVVNIRGEVLFGYDRRGKTLAGIGANDKNGIWICLKCLEEFDVLKCAFFVDEERGALGSGAADMKFFDDCRFVVQCDRKGSSDLYKCLRFVRHIVADCTEVYSHRPVLGHAYGTYRRGYFEEFEGYPYAAGMMPCAAFGDNL